METKSGALLHLESLLNCFESKKLPSESSLTVVTISTQNLYSKPPIFYLCLTCVIFLNYSLCKDLYRFLPSSFNNIWIKNEARRAENVSMVIRNHDEFFVPTSRLKTYGNFPLYSFPKLWLNLQSDSIKIIRNVYEFNLKLKEQFIDALYLNVVCEKLTVLLVTHSFKIGSDLIFHLSTIF